MIKRTPPLSSENPSSYYWLPVDDSPLVSSKVYADTPPDISSRWRKRSFMILNIPICPLIFPFKLHQRSRTHWSKGDRYLCKIHPISWNSRTSYTSPWSLYFEIWTLMFNNFFDIVLVVPTNSSDNFGITPPGKFRLYSYKASEFETQFLFLVIWCIARTSWTCKMS